LGVLYAAGWDFGGDGKRTYYDAFGDLPDNHFEIVVVDPLFEDVLSYCVRCLHRLKFEYVLVESGNVADIAWNQRVRDVLNSLGDEKKSESPGQFGKRIYVYRRR
jgi:hypothetical protein